MCCFSLPVQQVSGTRIFARASGSSQLLVYSMSLLARHDVAMILPLPVPPRSAEDAVRFINLEGYPRFFDDLANLFPPELQVQSGGISRGGPPRSRQLVVHDVGSFEASFVPSIADFNRLDARFRLPTKVWSNLPQYKDWGFAVFKLKGHAAAKPQSWLGRLFGSGAGSELADEEAAQRVHPMAFAFPRRDDSQLFFPTIHIHDGAVHETAHFEHTLYCQLSTSPPSSWEPSPSSIPLGQVMDLQRAGEILDPAAAVYRRVIQGQQPNQDTVVNLRT